MRDFPVEQLSAALRDSSAHLWVDLSDSTQAEQEKVLGEIFRFHPLAIEDVTSSLLVPKLNDYRQYLFLVIHSIYPGEGLVDLVSSELDIFLGTNFLVTIHNREMNAIEELMADDEYHQSDGLGRGVALLLYELMDRQVDRYGRLLERFEAELERLGDVIFHQQMAREDVLDDLLTAQSSALRLARVLRPQRDLMSRLSRGDYGVIPNEARLYFADVDDHLVRLVGLVEGMQALVRSTIDIYLALSDNRMNDIMRVLTVISTIFLPLTFLTGIYGMNFAYMPELQVAWAYPLMWVIFLIITFGLLRYFRRVGWL